MKIRYAALAAVAAMVVGTTAQAAIPFTGSYSENFDSIGVAGTAAPTDWTAGALNASRQANGGGATDSRALIPDDGTNGGQAPNSQGTMGKNFNYGVAGVGPVTDRAIGAICTTSGFGDAILQVALTNNTGAPITSLQIGYTGEQWRYGQGDSFKDPNNQGERLRVFYSTLPDSGWTSIGLDFQSPRLIDNTDPIAGPVQDDRPSGTDYVALDGNDASNRTILSTTYTLPAPLADGGNFYIRWQDWNENTTADHGIAVDNVTIAVPEPTSMAVLGLGALALIRRRRA